MRGRTALRGEYHLTHRDQRGRLLWSRTLPNGVTVQGCNHYNDVLFGGAARVASWRIGLIADAGFDQLRPTDTHDSHPGWQEYLAVQLLTRPAWDAAAAAGGRKSSAAPTTIQVTAAGTVRGVFLASRAGVGDVAAAGVLWSTAAAAEGLAVVANGTVTVTYEVAAEGTE